MQTYSSSSQYKIVNFTKDAKFHEVNKNDEITCETNDEWESCRDTPVSTWIENIDWNDEDRVLQKTDEALVYISRNDPIN